MRLYPDANFFIEAIEGAGAVREACLGLLDLGEADPGLLVTSHLTPSEVLVHPLRERADELAQIYKNLIADSGRLADSDPDRTIFVDAASVRSVQQTIKLPDAIHLATARALKCSHLVSGDGKLRSAAEKSDIYGVDLDELEPLLTAIEATS